MRDNVNTPLERKCEEFITALTPHLRESKALRVVVPRERRVFVTVAHGDLKAALTFLVKELGFQHLSTMTGVDLGDRMEVLYHLNDGRTALSLRVPVRQDDPRLPTVTDVLPGAKLYEREVHELFGIVFEGHPNPAPLLLPDDWPEGLYPMKKKLSSEMVRGVLADARATTQNRR